MAGLGNGATIWSGLSCERHPHWRTPHVWYFHHESGNYRNFRILSSNRRRPHGGACPRFRGPNRQSLLA